MLKRLVKYLRDLGRQNVLPSNVKLTTNTGPNTMGFNLNVSVEVGVDVANHVMAINVRDVGITSQDDLARKFIEGSDGKTVKDTIAVLALAAGLQAQAASQEAFSRKSVKTLVATEEDLKPKDPDLLN